jgi:Zn-dependent peptidase ImmA (M78 family)
VVASTLVIKNTKVNPAGTFSMARKKQQKAIITYDPSQVKNPEMLVATFAHELGHYLSHRTTEAPPEGEALWEPATDLLAVFMGFWYIFSK